MGHIGYGSRRMTHFHLWCNDELSYTCACMGIPWYTVFYHGIPRQYHSIFKSHGPYQRSIECVHWIHNVVCLGVVEALLGPTCSLPKYHGLPWFKPWLNRVLGVWFNHTVNYGKRVRSTMVKANHGWPYCFTIVIHGWSMVFGMVQPHGQPSLPTEWAEALQNDCIFNDAEQQYRSRPYLIMWPMDESLQRLVACDWFRHN